MDTNTTPGQNDADRSFPRWLKWGLLGALAILVVGYGAIFLYAKVLNDSPEQLGQADLVAVLAGGDDTGTAPVADTVADTVPESSTTATTSTDGSTATTDGSTATTDPPAADGDLWQITDESELGYRVKEILFGVDTEAVGRTNQITGFLTIDGTQVSSAQFVVDVASIESDEGRRDSQFRGRIMSTDDFPDATFTLAEPIELGTEAIDGASVQATATGGLTLRGVTNPVTFEVTAGLQSGKIGVLGNIPVVFADYGIANPSIGGISTEDNGLLEFVLAFVPA